MPTKLIGLHGYSLNGERMRKQMAELAGALAPYVELAFPDGLHVCNPATVEKLRAAWASPDFPPPHLSWWDASQDGTIYRGWDETREQMRECVGEGPAGLFGFSQGGMLAATLAALSSRGGFPPLRFAVIVAGRKPRAAALQSLFDTAIAVPSLHVWGEADKLSRVAAEALTSHFDPATREVVRWPGPHVIPTRGPAADAIVDFIRRHA
jgi:hypothetical protein